MEVTEGADPAPNAERNPDGSMKLVIGQTAPDDNKKMFNDFVPEEFRGKEWVENIRKADNPRLEIFKQIEHKDSLIGKQVSLNVPGEGATEEQIKQFHKAIGVPETADEYKYEGLKIEAEGDDKKFAELIAKSRSPEYMKELAVEAHKRGITPKAFAELAEVQDKLILKHNKAALAQAQANAEANRVDLVKRSTEIFGARQPQVEKNAMELLKLVPANVQPFINTLNNEGKIALAAVLDSIHSKYVKEDSVTPNRGATHTGSTMAEMRKERLALLDSPAHKDVSHAGHADAKKAVAEINARMRQLSL